MTAPEHILDLLRRDIEAVAQAAADAPDAVGWCYLGDAGEERRVLDDLQAGRIHFAAAKRAARRASDALDRGDVERAEVALRQAKDMLAAAVARQLRTADLEALARPARKRGRTAAADRDHRFAAAVAAQEARGVFGKAARFAALNGDPVLASEFGAGIGDPALRAALRRAGKL